MQPRIAPASPPFAREIQATFDRTLPPGTPPLALFTTMARDERLFGRFFGGALLDRGHLTLRQREIVIDRTTALCRSEYEWGVHVAFFAGRAGLSGEQLRSLVHGSACDPCWSEADRLLIDLCDELHETASVGEALWGQLRAAHSEEALLELLMLAGLYRMVSYLTNALRLPLEAYGARFPAQ
ncbi:MAG TPA: carboxymuconolactone decarboxylase family protein [Usitatibacter sp.]|nr:carboxymuconolactone decarboxylase family protein [Usitatibacter sp.]